MLAQAAAPINFVLQHKCRRWESLISVAVQYLADTTAIRVLNNLTTDHSLRSREYVYVPGETCIARVCDVLLQDLLQRSLVTALTLCVQYRRSI